ncbi:MULTISPECIES: LysM peptidoglycan-binding domain-containing protein [Asaia]|uniref:LysM peptidoglycan-binding domain-containing protein n=1 Tax=Asaia TaxID=91914 RepID=UPI002555835D|nr:LysM peptidoglycan-binding domain-containing protein [Asaia sp. HumB]MDL2170165.1 LysM peptidoglycan-binding domain-containing protein [Asaia sp. HumB]
MAIFKFNRAAGRKLDEQAKVAAINPAGAPAPKAPHESLIKRAFKQYGMSQLSVSHITVRDSTIALKGKAESAAERDAMILAAGNIAGIDTVHADITVPEGTPAPVFHQVSPGETLDAIAEKTDADVTAEDLHKANEAELAHHDGVYPGQTIRIPEA